MWTKSQKVSAAVLGLAVTAFCVDRFVLDSGKPAPASATEDLLVSHTAGSKGSSTATSGKSAVKAVALNGAAKSGGANLAGRLAALAEARKYDVELTSDAFLASQDWLATYNVSKGLGPNGLPLPAAAGATAAAAPAPGDAEKPKKPDLAANFRSIHKLSAVMTRRGGALAIVDGKLYATGQTIDGWTLSKVGLTDATFDGHNTSVTLSLPGQLNTTAAQSTGNH